MRLKESDLKLSIRLARHMGSSLAKIKLFLDGLRDGMLVGPRWRKRAHRKLKEVDGIMERTRAES